MDIVKVFSDLSLLQSQIRLTGVASSDVQSAINDVLTILHAIQTTALSADDENAFFTALKAAI
jgi:hypothetical protein